MPDAPVNSVVVVVAVVVVVVVVVVVAVVVLGVVVEVVVDADVCTISVLPDTETVPFIIVIGDVILLDFKSNTLSSSKLH